MTRQYGIHCTACGVDLYSNSHHDWEECDCGAWNIDGGFEYERLGGHGVQSYPHTRVSREVDRTKLPRYYREERDEMEVTGI